MSLFRRRGRPTAEMPLHPSHDTEVAGHPVRVYELPWSVCARLDGRILQQPIAVRPREAVAADPRLHAAVQGWLAVFDERPHAVATGDPTFDARYVVHGPLSLQPRVTLTEPVRAALLAHDVLAVVAQANGAWVGVGHTGPAGPAGAGPAGAERAALALLAMLVRA